MVEKRNCSFCGNPIEPGTGKMYVRKDGTIYTFCSNKCKKNRIDLGRVPRRTKWTVRYSELKASSLKRKRGAEDEEPGEGEENEKPIKKPVKRKSIPREAQERHAKPATKKSAPVPARGTASLAGAKKPASSPKKADESKGTGERSPVTKEAAKKPSRPVRVTKTDSGEKSK
jgi:large subunit ribosomal protein L24e